MDKKLRLGNRLRAMRADAQLSQNDLARLVRVTRQTISSIETGQYVPSAELAFLLAAALKNDVTTVFFLEEVGDEQR